MILSLILVILMLLIIIMINDSKQTKLKHQQINEQKEEQSKKREYCEYFIKQIKETKSLNTLLSIHKLCWAIGLRNQNLGPDEYGMFRTNDILKMTSKEVYLGNISGLWTKTLADWSNNHKEEYQIVFEQYQKHLISNLTAIKLSLCN